MTAVTMMNACLSLLLGLKRGMSLRVCLAEFYLERAGIASLKRTGSRHLIEPLSAQSVSKDLRSVTYSVHLHHHRLARPGGGSCCGAWRRSMANGA
jgi:hypothetical protein